MCLSAHEVVHAGIFTSITKSDGRDNGPGNDPTYDNVNVTRVWVISTSISCSGPGAEGCPSAVVGPGRDADSHTEVEQAGVNHAKAQIAAGTLAGNTTFSISGNSNIKQLKWSATSTAFRTGFIKIWVYGDPEP